VKPAAVDGPGREGMVSSVLKGVESIWGRKEPAIHVSELAGALIGGCVNRGNLLSATLWPEELVKVGKGVVGEDDYLR
jgi:hypothetical protein